MRCQEINKQLAKLGDLVASLDKNRTAIKEQVALRVLVVVVVVVVVVAAWWWVVRCCWRCSCYAGAAWCWGGALLFTETSRWLFAGTQVCCSTTPERWCRPVSRLSLTRAPSLSEQTLMMILWTYVEKQHIWVCLFPKVCIIMYKVLINRETTASGDLLFCCLSRWVLHDPHLEVYDSLEFTNSVGSPNSRSCWKRAANEQPCWPLKRSVAPWGILRCLQGAK